MIATIQIPPGAVTVASPPALFGAECAAYLGMREPHARRVLDDMSRDPKFASCVVVLSRRPRELAAPPEEVVRFLRLRRACAPPTEPADVTVVEPDGIDQDLADLGFSRTSPRRGAR
jgi:hypothetical protein